MGRELGRVTLRRLFWRTFSLGDGDPLQDVRASSRIASVLLAIMKDGVLLQATFTLGRH